MTTTHLCIFTKFFLCSSESEPPSSLVSGIIDYNMPLTSTYLKQMKLRVMNSQEQVSYPPAMGQCKARGGFLPLGLWGG